MLKRCTELRGAQWYFCVHDTFDITYETVNIETKYYYSNT